MHSALVLSSDELVDLTGRKRADAQERELEHMGVPHCKRSDGSLVVLRSVVEQRLGAEVQRATMARPEPQLMP